MAFQQKDGRGALFKNWDKKPESQQPDYKGKCMVNGVEMEVAAWVKEAVSGEFLSLSFNPPRPKPTPELKLGDKKAPEPKKPEDELDVPF